MAQRQEASALGAELATYRPSVFNAVAPKAHEIEPNDDSVHAGHFESRSDGASTFAIQGSLAKGGDADYFSFQVPAGSRAWAYVNGGGTKGSNGDTVLTLLGTDGRSVLERDDDDGLGTAGPTKTSVLSSAISGYPLAAAGTYFVRIAAADGESAIENYSLHLAVTPSGVPDTTAPVVGPSALVGTRSGTITVAGNSEIHPIVATAGDLLYLAADGNPERVGSGTDVSLALLDSDASTVLLDADAAPDLAGSSAEAFTYRVVRGGTYYVRIGRVSQSGAGSYSVLVARSPLGSMTGCIPGSDQRSSRKWER